MIDIDLMFFDVDGTLVDSRKDIANAVNHMLESFGMAGKPDDIIASYIGFGVKDLVRKSFGVGSDEFARAIAAKRLSSDEAVDEGEKAFVEYYAAHPAVDSTLYPHVIDVLEHFKGKHKYVLTNRYKRFADATLRALGIIGYFEDIFGGDDESCMKPSTCVVERIARDIKVMHKNAIIIGDMDVDIMTGKNSGMKTCWVSYGLGKIDSVAHLKPDYIIDDMVELKGIVQL